MQTKANAIGMVHSPPPKCLLMPTNAMATDVQNSIANLSVDTHFYYEYKKVNLANPNGEHGLVKG